MFRVVLDSNVIARAVMSPNGLAADLLTQLVKSEHQLCTSDFMLAELVRVLSYSRLQKRHRLDDQKITAFGGNHDLSANGLPTDSSCSLLRCIERIWN